MDAQLTVEAGHDIAVEARRRVIRWHRVLNLMTHVDPWKRPDLDHPVATPPTAQPALVLQLVADPWPDGA